MIANSPRAFMYMAIGLIQWDILHCYGYCLTFLSSCSVLYVENNTKVWNFEHTFNTCFSHYLRSFKQIESSFNALIFVFLNLLCDMNEYPRFWGMHLYSRSLWLSWWSSFMHHYVTIHFARNWIQLYVVNDWILLWLFHVRNNIYILDVFVLIYLFDKVMVAKGSS